MIEKVAIFSILLRVLTICVLSYVIVRQVRILKPPTDLQWLKRLLISLAIVMICNSVLSIYVNFYRQADGNLMPNIRRTAQVFNALAGLSSATILAIIYYRNDT